jgi:Trk K+ transport system NAD-binding subunit
VADTDLSRRVLLAVGGGAVMLVAYATVYRWGMATFEGEHLSYVRALQVVLEALTTAGFGGDAPWASTEMNLLVIAMNLTGVSLVFFAVPFFVVPLLEDALRTTVPTDSSLSGHVVVCADSPRETPLRAELDEVTAEPLFVKSDESLVRNLLQDGYAAMYGDPERRATLDGANISAAEAVIVDIGDEANASVILAARRLAPDVRIVSVVEDGDTASYHEYAGADEVIQPRVAVGRRLATKVGATQFHESVTADWDTAVLELTELLVDQDHELVGQTLRESQFRQRYGVTVLGGWFHGEFVAPVDPDRTLVEHTVLLVAGHTDDLHTLKRNVTAESCDSAVVAGYGVVGETVTEQLRDSGVDVTVVDTEQKAGVDVVGDVTDPETLEQVDLAGVDAVVLTLARDSLAVYTGLVLEEHAPGIDTLARADNVEYVQKCYDAGVEFTLALSEVTAHMIAERLFASHSGPPATGQYEIACLRVPDLAGKRLGETNLRTESGVHVVGVERAGTLHSNPDPSLEIEQSDVLLLAGNQTDIASLDPGTTADS